MSWPILKRTIALTSCLSLAIGSSGADASPWDINYGGRLANGQGNAVSGPVNITAVLYSAQTEGSALATLSFPATALEDGFFDLDLPLDQVQTAFAAGGDVWIEIQDTSNNVTYPRQHLSAVPYALTAAQVQSTAADGTSIVLKNGKLSVS